MKRKIAAMTIWIFLTIVYCFNMADIGRSMGSKINLAMEHLSSDEPIDKYAYGDYYSHLDSHFKFNFIVISVTTVIYVGVTVLCYHFAFTKKADDSNKL